ncbi:MAG: hypothetical protein ACE5G0_10985 [Rhodothermales bacterium]
MKTLLKNTLATLSCTALLLAGCAREPSDSSTDDGNTLLADSTEQTSPPEARDMLHAAASLISLRNSGVLGRFDFNEVENGLYITGVVHRLAEGRYGTSIYEDVVCSATNSEALGDPIARLAMLESAGRSISKITYTDSLLTLNGASSILGKAVVVHTGETARSTADLLACGIIEEKENTVASLR